MNQEHMTPEEWEEIVKRERVKVGNDEYIEIKIKEKKNVKK